MKDHHSLSTHADGRDGVVCCLVGDEQFALRTADVRLIARAEDMQRDCGDERIGTLRQGSRVVPVYCLSTLLGRSGPAATAGRHIVVTAGALGPYGLLVDRVVRSGRTEKLDVLPLPSAVVGPIVARWFEGLVQMGDLSCLALSPAGFEPGAPARPVVRTTPAPPPSARRAAAAAEIAVIFSTGALPSCAERRYALSARQIAAVVQELPCVPLPGAPAFVRGLAAWRRRAVPVVDLGTGDAGRRAGGRSLVVGTRDGALVGFAVDPDLVVYRVTSGDTLVGGRTAFVKGVFVAGTERAALLDIDALLASQRPAFVAECAV